MRGERLPIHEHGLVNVPEPRDEVFRRRTLALLQEADDYCRDQIGLPRVRWEATFVRPRPKARGIAKPHRPVTGFCCGCGCPYDEETPDCMNCYSRHAMRRLGAERRRLRRLVAA